MKNVPLIIEAQMDASQVFDKQMDIINIFSPLKNMQFQSVPQDRTIVCYCAARLLA